MDFRSEMDRNQIAALKIQPTSQFLERAPNLRAFVSSGKAAPWLSSAVDALSTALPMAPSSKPFARGTFYRPVGHARAFYFSPAPSHEPGRPVGSLDCEGVLAFKGLEPLTDDFDDLLRRLEETYVATSLVTSQRRWAEHFALRENKVPGAVVAKEVLSDAEVCLQFQSKHLEVYGELSQLPLPLMAYRYDAAARERILTALRSRLSSDAYDRAEWLSEGGFGAYVYFFPGPTVRVSELDGWIARKTFGERLEELRRHVDPEQTLQRWARAVARMLYLGYLPATLASCGFGDLCGAQNAIVSGGFVDTDSLTPMSAVRSDTAFCDAMQQALHHSLTKTAMIFLVGTDNVRYFGDDFTTKAVFDHVTECLRQAMESEKRPGLSLDSRAAAYLNDRRSYRDLEDLFGRYFPRGERMALNCPFNSSR